MPLVKAGEVDLDCERSGSGPPLLLIMGMSGVREHWGQPFLDALRADFEVIAYDHRGVGASSRMREPFTIADLARDALALLDALGLDSAHVLGISMGGMVAQELALAAPERLRTLTLGCTYCGGPGSALTSDEVMRKLGQAMASRDRERAIRASWEVNVSEAFAGEQEAAQRFMAIGMRRGVALPVVMQQMVAITAHDTSERLGELAVPTLIVHGSADQLLPVGNADVIHGLIDGSRLQIMEGVGHLFFWEHPQRSAQLLREHIAVHA